MKVFKTIPVFILLLTGYLCNAESEETTNHLSFEELHPTMNNLSLEELHLTTNYLSFEELYTTIPTATPPPLDEYAPAERSLPTLVVAGVSIALVLLCILMVTIFWYAWKKSQEGSIELNPLPYGEAGVSLRSLSAPENQQEWPFERAVQ